MAAEEKKKGRSDAGGKSVEERLKALEDRLDALLSGKVDLEIVDVSVAPRSRLRVQCE